ncbi:hypothetical protein L9G74_18165 [Shewanella sp. C32]|uniref:Uncharacterized protein n=1 Tax=Shewanella electrica TaxID=515560 RepID=A0ABT2FQQ0_9GAMM|nr:hypothetical protein [Shewanella electrica]MCH1926805.1 hypothetical protein [Shewanella electrica]MCS4558366.1 hypothetical protein [Shewanella electrica]
MELSKAVIIAAIILALAIIISPTLLQKYKTEQCLSAYKENGAGGGKADELTCVQILN